MCFSVSKPNFPCTQFHSNDWIVSSLSLLQPIGNPDGDDVTIGGVDPGLLVTRRILDLTYDNQALSSLDSHDHHVPDQVTFVPRDNCIQLPSSHVFYGAKTYQDALSDDVELDSMAILFNNF